MATDSKYAQDSISEEASALGQRVKGAVKDGVGGVTGNESLEREGELENTEGRKRQGRNDAIGGNNQPSASSSWSNKNLVTGLYDSPDSAGKAYQDLTTRHGYRPDDISVVMSDDTRKRHFGDVKPGQEFKEGSKAAEGAGIGGGIGIGVGAAIGAVVAAATAIAIPGIGLIVAGPIAGAIAGAGAGGATGTLVGALIGAGIPEARATEYERGLKEGGIVLGTRAKNEAHATSSSATSRVTAHVTFGAKQQGNGEPASALEPAGFLLQPPPYRSSRPVLAPMLSISAPATCAIASSRFAVGSSFFATT